MQWGGATKQHTNLAAMDDYAYLVTADVHVMDRKLAPAQRSAEEGWILDAFVAFLYGETPAPTITETPLNRQSDYCDEVIVEEPAVSASLLAAADPDVRPTVPKITAPAITLGGDSELTQLAEQPSPTSVLAPSNPSMPKLRHYLPAAFDRAACKDPYPNEVFLGDYQSYGLLSTW